MGRERATGALLADLVRALTERSELRVRRLLADDAELTMFFTDLKPTRGADAVLQALRERGNGVWMGSVGRVDELDDRRAIVRGRVRMPVAEGGLVDREIVWLGESADGVLTRVVAYGSEEDARASLPEAEG